MDDVISSVNFTTTLHNAPTIWTDPSKVILSAPCSACIIGAGRGIGAEIALSYAKAGATSITISSRTLHELSSIAEKIYAINSSIDVLIVQCDVRSKSSVENLADKVKEQFGRLDILVSSAGFYGALDCDITKGNPVDFQQNFDVNCIGTYHLAHYFIPILLNSENGRKAFIVVSAFAAFLTGGPIANTAYCLSKMAQCRLIEFVDKQYGNQGIFAVAIHPGAVRTAMAVATPKEFEDFLVDSPSLCGGVCVWLTKDLEKQWLSGRFISSNWDVQELLTMKDDIVKGDKLKLRLVV